jgi:hypothetical protein
MLFKVSGLDVLCSRKTDKLRIHTQFHVAFAPKIAPVGLHFVSGKECAANFPSIIKGLWSPDIFPGLATQMPIRLTLGPTRLGDAF